MRRAVAGRAVLGVADQMMPAPNQIILGHNLLVLRTWPDACMDSCVVDPPYGLKFMGKAWDADVPKAIIWKQVLRVLKPGGHLLSFFGTRTYHRGVCAIEDAGFEIRDQIGYCYGSGFPKSLDISRAIDKAAGAKRKVIGKDHTQIVVRASTEPLLRWRIAHLQRGAISPLLLLMLPNNGPVGALP